MSAPTPQKLLTAIAADANPSNITAPMPDAPPVSPANAASIEDGFPPITMQSELSGGLPPLGPDMNGLLFLLSSHTLWVQCGQAYLFDTDIASAIGGYALGSILGMADGSGLWLSIINNNSNNPDTGGAGWAPLYSYAHANVTGLTGGTVNLTAAQYKKAVIVLSGTLVSNLVINLPPLEQEWLIINRTTGGFSTVVKTAASGSAGVTVPQGGFSAPTGVYSVADNNIYPTVAPLSVPIDQNPTPNTLVERTSAGYVLATYLNQNSNSVENPPIGAVFVENTGADGFLRKAALAYFESVLALQNMGGQIQPSQIVSAAVTQFASLLFSSPTMTGTPTAPTAGTGTSNTQIATTAFANPNVTINGNGTAIQLPSGHIIQFGVCNPNGGSVTINLPRNFPTQCIIAGAFGPAAPTQHNATIVGTGQLTVKNTGGISYFLAIGN